MRPGALIESDSAIVDLSIAARGAGLGAWPAFTSILALVEAGEEAMAEARRMVALAPTESVIERASVKLCAPIQPPPQMRDCSCFELHLKQSFAAARRARVAHLPNPE
jgi:hypothetical protein